MALGSVVVVALGSVVLVVVVDELFDVEVVVVVFQRR